MRKLHCIFLVLALMTALFVSCSQDNVGNAVTNDLVSVSFTTGGSRALTVSRETFDENNYVWYYKAQKADSTGLTTGAQSTWTPVKPLDETPRTGLSGAIIDGISQGLWNFELQAYAYDSQDPQDKDYPTTGVAVWNGKVTNQPVKKGEANIVNVTVSAIATGNGTINWSGISGMKDLGGVIKNLQEIIFVNPDAELKVPTGMKVYISATAFGATEPEDGMFITIDEDNIEAVTGLFEDVEAGTYLFNAVVFSGASVDDADFVYADETIAINVYSVLQTIIKGYISELASYVEFGEPVANAVIEASTESVIDVDPEGDAVDFNTDSTQSTSYQTASIPAMAVVTIKDEIVEELEDGIILTDLALALNVEDKGTTDASTTTTKNFEISLDAIVTTTDETSGLVSVESQSVDAIEEIMVVELYIGKDLTVLEVQHGGNSMSKDVPGTDGEFYEYDGDAGILTLHVNHFSPFSVDYVKKVAVARLIKADGTGSDFYTLPEAIDAASDGDTIRLLTDLDFSQEPYSDYKWGSTYHPLEITNNDITLDLNGKTIENMGNCALVFGHILAVDGRISNVTIKNGTLKAGKTSGVTNSYVLGIAGADGALIENVTTDGGINVYTLSQDVVIKNCTVNGTKYYTVCAQTGSEVTIEGDDGAFSKNTDSTVATKAMFWVDNAGKDSDAATPENPEGNYGASSITIKDGIFTIDTAHGGLFYLSSGLKPVARGGIYNIDPSAYAPADCLVEEIGDGWYEVIPLTLVEAKDSNCSEEGFHTHWEDYAGNKYIVDGNARRSATDVDLIIPTHHYWVYESRSESPDANGKYSVTYKCQACNETKVVDGWTLVQFEDNTSETPVNLWSCLEPLTKTDLSGEKTIFELGEGLYTVRSTGGAWVSPKECYLRTECIIVGSGSESTTIQIANDSWWKKGIQLYNRYMKESGIPQSNFQFAGLTIEDTSADASSDFHLLLITSYGVELGLNDVTFKSFKGTTNVGFWANQTLSDGKYPTKADAQGIYISLKDVEFVNTVKPFIQNQSFTAANIAGQSDCYSSVHLLVDGSVEDLTLASQNGNNIHDGIHTEWFVNGNIVRVPGTVGLYGTELQ